MAQMTPELQQILKVFINEGLEQLNSLDDLLIEIENNPSSQDLLKQFMRTAHNFKGSAGTLGLDAFSELAHQIESAISLLKSGTVSADSGIFDRIFQTLDIMRKSLDTLAATGETPLEIPEECSAFDRWIQSVSESEKSDGDRTDNDLVVGEFDRVVIESLVSQGKNVHRIDVYFTEGTVAPAETCDAISKEIEKNASIILTYPSTDEIKNAQSLRRYALLVGGSGTEKEYAELVAKHFAGTVEVSLYASPSATGRTSRDADVRGQAGKGSARIDLERVDSLLEMIGELVIVESMVANVPEISGITSLRVKNYIAQLNKITRDLQGVGMRMRMLPLRELFQRMARLVRDMSKKTGKRVELTVTGEGTEIDRAVVERLADPLTHIIRNAIDHGIEDEETRRAAGKPVTGEIRLSAYYQGGNVLVEIADDGTGLDRDAILAKAIDMGLAPPDANLSDNAIYNFIFASGLSTARTVTAISGRGIGMDIVRKNVELMHGRATVSSEPGRGTNFKLVLPLTTAIIDGMLVACGTENYIIPTLSIVESMKPTSSMISMYVNDRELINVRGAIFPLIRLDTLFEIAGAQRDATQALVVIVESLGRKVGLLVDDVLMQQQVVIKDIGGKLRDAEYLCGAAILSDGRVGLIINVDEICQMADKFNYRVFKDAREAVSTP